MTVRASNGRAPAFLPKGAKAFFRRRLADLASLALVALAGLSALSLATYSPADPSFNSAGPSLADSGLVANKAGLIGAHVADLVLQGPGVAGAALVLLFLAWSWALISRRGIPHYGLKLALALLGVALAAIGFASLPQPADWPLESGMGGSLGRIVSDALLPGVQTIGASASALAALAFLLGFAAFVPALGLRFGEWWAIGSTPWRAALFAGRIAAKPLARRGLEELPRGRARGLKRTRAEPHLGPERGGAGFEEIDVRKQAPARRARDQPPLEIVEKRRPRARPGKRGEAERQGMLDLLSSADYQLPPLDLLRAPPEGVRAAANEDALAQNARLLESVLDDFGVKGEIVKVRPGPVVTLYELEPAPGTKSSRVIGLSDDIARYMSAVSVRASVVPGRNVIGIEIPNAVRETVYLRELLSTEAYEKTAASLTLALGKEIGGAPVIVDLARMPHLLVAGTTGSGKSVAINSMILSLLYRLPPDQCKFILIDPKMLELSVYEGIPQLLTPVVTEPSKAVVALKWTVREMESRYQAMSQLGVRSIASYNRRIAEARAEGKVLSRTVQTGFDPGTGEPIFEDQPLDLEALPLIVVIVDEMADLMILSGKDVEGTIQRLSQMARAAGIHIIMATQRPSVDVITGTIKANFPTRISFQVSSKIDSRTILGDQGAEQLLGAGDMLYMESAGRIMRVHGPFVSDAEVERVVTFLKKQGQPEYIDAITEAPDTAVAFGLEQASDEPLYEEAVSLICRERKASTSFIQRHLQIGYNRAARIIERMEAEGVVGPANHVGKREVLALDASGQAS